MVNSLGARLSGLIGDRTASNNIVVEDFSHDRPPVAKQATVMVDNVIERGSIFTELPKVAQMIMLTQSKL